MIVTYARSSSIGAYDWCPFKYYLVYGLGFEDEPNFKAIKGTCTHKALELLARRKLAEQKGEKRVWEEELKVDLPVVVLTPAKAINMAFEFYKDAYPQFPWSSDDFADCKAWMTTALEFSNGLFSPLKREIVAPEIFFDFEIDKPWAQYSFRLKDKVETGKFRIRGTMDLLTRGEDGVLEYIDWKTGKMVKYGPEGARRKEYEDFQKDPQLLLYYYALRKLYDEPCMMTVFYLQDGGPQSVFFSDEDLPRAEEMLKNFFETVKTDQNPRRILRDREPGQNTTVNWKCFRLCGFYKNKTPAGLTQCEDYHRQLQQLGMPAMTNKHAQVDRLKYYQGGGRQSRVSNSEAK